MTREELYRILRCLHLVTGRSYDPKDFRRRLRIQKSIYLLKSFGYRPAHGYRFNLYLSGPYSPLLARDYYALPSQEVPEVMPAKIPDRYLRPVTEAVTKGNKFLESAATLLFIANYNEGKTKAELFRHYSGIKPTLKGRLEEAWEFLKKYRLLRELT